MFICDLLGCKYDLTVLKGFGNDMCKKVDYLFTQIYFYLGGK